jgi:hypothetical protein
MRPRLLICLALLALAACTPPGTSVFYAEGVDFPTRDADFAQCELQALREFPVRNVTRFTPRFYVPARQVCRPDGTCIVTPGYFEGGDPYTVDGNVNARQVATRGCMGERGYARVTLPVGAPDTAVIMSTVMPPLVAGTCIYRPGGAGPRLIVNPA